MCFRRVSGVARPCCIFVMVRQFVCKVSVSCTRNDEDAGSWYTATITSKFPTAAVPYEGSAELHKLLVKSVDSVSGEVDLPYDTLLDWGAVIGEPDSKHLIDSNNQIANRMRSTTTIRSAVQKIIWLTHPKIIKKNLIQLIVIILTSMNQHMITIFIQTCQNTGQANNLWPSADN